MSGHLPRRLHHVGCEIERLAMQDLQDRRPSSAAMMICAPAVIRNGRSSRSPTDSVGSSNALLRQAGASKWGWGAMARLPWNARTARDGRSGLLMGGAALSQCAGRRCPRWGGEIRPCVSQPAAGSSDRIAFLGRMPQSARGPYWHARCTMPRFRHAIKSLERDQAPSGERRGLTIRLRSRPARAPAALHGRTTGRGRTDAARAPPVRQAPPPSRERAVCRDFTLQ